MYKIAFTSCSKGRAKKSRDSNQKIYFPKDTERQEKTERDGEGYAFRTNIRRKCIARREKCDAGTREMPPSGAQNCSYRLVKFAEIERKGLCEPL